MSRERMSFLRNNILVGYTDNRGDAWWNARGATDENGKPMGTRDDGNPNHYAGAIPIKVVERDLFNFEIVESPLYVPNFNGGLDDPEYLAVPNRKAIRTSDTGDVLGVFRNSYAIHQPMELIDTVRNILDSTVSIGNAGMLRNRAVAFVQIEVPENIVTPEGVEFRPTILGITSHDGTIATTFKRVVTNVVCDNTMAMARNEAGQEIKVKHTLNSGFKIQNARDALAVIHSAEDDFAAEVAEWSKRKVSAKAFTKFLDIWSPIPEGGENGASKRAITMAETRRETFTGLYKSDPRVAPWNGTGWGILQGLNTFEQHFTSVKQGEMNDAEKARARYERTILSVATGDLSKSYTSDQEMVLAALS